MIFDSHAHYDDEQFDIDREQLLEELPKMGVGTIVNVSANYASWRGSVELAERYLYIYAAVGTHPDEVGVLNEDTFAEMKAWCQKEKVVAIGEIGLDYYWDNQPREVQKKWFIRQLELARELQLPVIIHSREAAEDTMEIVKKYAQGLEGVIHCYSYAREQAEEYIKMGFYIGIGGVLTFKNARKLKEVASAIPLEKILLETDCPYLAPTPYRGKRNQSSYISYIAEALADIKQISKEEVIAVTEANAKKMYHLV